VDPHRDQMAELTRRETDAEKLRAALPRHERAIRDFYDVDHGVRSGRLSTSDRRLVKVVKSKLAAPGNNNIDVSDEKHETLKRQVQAQPRRALRETDFAAFDL
jgi:hypothetical protein